MFLIFLSKTDFLLLPTKLKKKTILGQVFYCEMLENITINCINKQQSF